MRVITCTAGLALMMAAAAHAQSEVEFWHAFSGNNGDAVGELAEMFNAS